MAHGVCHFFEAGVKCPRAKCRYKHSATGTSAPGQKRYDDSKPNVPSTSRSNGANHVAIKDEFADVRKKWLFCIPQDKRKSRPLGDKDLRNFLAHALSLIDSNVDNMQRVISKLGEECGLMRVLETIDRDFAAMNGDELGPAVTTLLMPCFRILSHETVMQSTVIETQHTTLLNTLYGGNGTRGSNIFTALARHLSTRNEPEYVEVSIAVLASMIDRNRSAIANTSLQAAAKELVALLDLANLSRANERHLRTINTVLQLAIDLPEARTNASRADPGAPVATFTIAQDWPGAMSALGPRHDNDSEDIQDIEILPTLEEILSERTEYLPREDPKLWHIPGLPGLIDRHFRLVREDTVGQLRDAVKAQLSHQRSAGQQTRVSKQGIRTNAYDDVFLCNVAFDDKKGVLFVLQFKQPQMLHDRSSRKREEWWKESQRLGPESLICLLCSGEDGREEVTFLVVHSPEFVHPNSKTKTMGPPIHEQHTLWDDGDQAFVIAQLASNEPDAASEFIKSCSSSRKVRRSLVEFPGVLLPTFGPTLSALQHMAATLDVPFSEVLVPAGDAVEPRPPAYSVRGDFQYNLRSLIQEDRRDQYHNTGDAKQDIASALELSDLDESQREAAQHALTHAISLIQGPPGTGKSYTGVKIVQALLENKRTGNLGPIICVCYTNHALDQLLEHLLDAGVTQIARIGSRSKSERLAGVNVRVLAHNHKFSSMEGKQWFESKKSIEDSGGLINKLVWRLDRILRNNEDELMSFLLEKYPALHAHFLQTVDEDGFTTVYNSRKNAPSLEMWLNGGAPPRFARPRGLAVLCSGAVRPTDMTREERELMRDSWVEELTSSIYLDLEVELSTFNNCRAAMDALRGDRDLRVLSDANVVGITTTGLARQINTLSKLPSKVLVVEEAGEVLEAHLLTAMLPSLEHAILIGDHQQLRPKVQNYDLSAENPHSAQIALDISLFERLLHPRQEDVPALPYVTLETQRRMHPSISQLIRSTLYPDLQDAEAVSAYPEVLGLRKRLFWMDHQHKEDGQDGQLQSTSRTNSYEVGMAAALVSHLQKQGTYAADDIAVLTPYLGQLRLLRKKLQSSCDIILNDRDVDELARDDAAKDEAAAETSESSPNRPAVTKGTLLQAVRLATVDNFQGEEAKVVIISLVRSNDSNNCGFLRTPNRINVLLSRAKHGMYIIGNLKTSSTVPMWQHVLEIFKANGNIGQSLELCCPRHPETPMQVTEPEHFTRVAPEAGCDLMCGKQLPCGHACPSKCHAESLHNGVYCLKDCMRPRKGCKHPCEKVCGDECDEQCTVIVDCDITPPCGHHVTKMPCWLFQDQASFKCVEPVERLVPHCGHEVVVACHVDINALGYRCNEPCSSMLECGHACTKACYRCRPKDAQETVAEAKHGKCTHKCGKGFNSCAHSCSKNCHVGEPCPPCPKPCEVCCIHSRCVKQCHEPCTPCTEEQCPSHCEHSQCRMPCGAPCDWVPCSMRCQKKMDCGHQCPSVCGEMCPPSKFCQVCAADEVRGIIVDLYTMETYAELDLDKMPCLFPQCGHIFTIETLDAQMEMSRHYDTMEVDDLSMPISVKGDLLPLSYDNLKTCPNCRGSLRTIARYGRIIRRTLLDESTKKFITWSNQAYVPIAKQVQQQHDELLETAGKTPLIESISFNGPDRLRAIRGATAGRYSALMTLRRSIAKYISKVRAEEQPFQRVRDLVESVRRRQNADVPEFEYDQSILQTRGLLLAVALSLRCDLVIITDLMRNWEGMSFQQRSAKSISMDLHKYRVQCDDLIESATNSKYPLQQAEGHIFWAQFTALECRAMATSGGDSLQRSEDLKREAIVHLDQAKEICQKFPGQTNSVSADVEGVRKMLENSISSAEMRMVVAVMSQEFGVSGHWYCCVNGHPFTIGECGGAMQQARCPECDAPIGGRDHQTAAGVTRAAHIERQFGGLRVEE